MSAVGVHPGTVRGGFARELRAGGWRVLLAGLVGVTLGISALPFYTLGIFAGPISREFGWSRADALSGLLFVMIGTVVAAGVAGSMIDRHGARRVALVGQIGLAAAFVLLAGQRGDALVWKASWFAMALLAVGSTPLSWSQGIAQWFTQARGTALGIALSGSGITAVIGPPLVGALIEAHGWRATYLFLAAAVLLVGAPCTWLLFRPPTSGGRDAAAEVQTGPDFPEVLRGYRFWLILAAFAGISFAIGGTIPNLVPMLQDQGVAGAAWYASVLGSTVIVGRLVAGWLLDRFWAPAVAVGLLALPAASCLLLASETAPAVAAALMGLAGGAEFDLVAFLSARYFGMRSFGRVYAWQWAGFALAAGVGSWAYAAIRDATGNYDTALYLAALLMAGGGLSLLGLGPYPTWRADPEQEH